MATLSIKTDSSGYKYRTGGPWKSTNGIPVEIEWDLGTMILFRCGTFQETIDTTTEVININDTVITGTPEQKYDAVRASFPKTNSGSGGSGLPNQAGNAGKYLTTNGSASSWATVAGGIELSATKAAVSSSVVVRFVRVAVDETNNGDKSLYLHNGSTLEFLLTIS